MISETALFSFWGKTDRRADYETEHARGLSFHPLIFHLLDVAACAEALLRQEHIRVERLAKRCGAKAADLSACFVALIALHDLGKCARGFQGKVLDLWPEFLGPKPGQDISVRHDAAGVWLFDNNDTLRAISEKLFPTLVASQRLSLIQAVCGHHGQPIETDTGGKYPDLRNLNTTIGRESQSAAVEIAEAIVTLLSPPSCSIEETTVPLASFWLSGLAVLSDWLGSNRTWFEFRSPPQEGALIANMQDYWQSAARPTALRALKEAGLKRRPIAPDAGLAALFGADYTPTPLQEYAQSVGLEDGPLLFIIEDMTGAGKTEAAVVLAHRLMLAGKAQGLHVALPTMATANAMFGRLSAHYQKMFEADSSPSTVLAHGRRDLFESFTRLTQAAARCDNEARDENDVSDIEASAFCADWIARSNKQAFLAQIGAGTIDQALLAVLPARHQSLRLWGLADKVLVIDEAHAYDPYMEKEIERLLEFHAALGGSAIVLSATLPQTKRTSLIKAFLSGADDNTPCAWRPSESAYPLMTSVSRERKTETPLALRESLARTVAVERIDTLDEVHRRALEAAQRGAAVAVIRNTVNESIESFGTLSKLFPKVKLFHARFALTDRHKIETEVLHLFGKGSHDGRNAIVVATQVIEQSLDLDFDLLISDLAPIDLLIQRAGRLWRHTRETRPIAGPNFLILSPEPSDDVSASWLKQLLPSVGYIYENPAVLWRSAKALFKAGKIVSCTSPACAAFETGEIRALVEAVYSEGIIPLPAALENAEIKALGDDYGKRAQAHFKLLDFAKGYDWDGVKWDREERVRTRLGEDTLTLRLARVEIGRLVPWAPIENEDWRHAWALSEVSLRRSLCAGVDHPPDVQKLVVAAQRRWSISEKEMPVVVLKEMGESAVWEAFILDKDKKWTTISYSKSYGLFFKRGNLI